MKLKVLEIFPKKKEISSYLNLIKNNKCYKKLTSFKINGKEYLHQNVSQLQVVSQNNVKDMTK